MDNKKSTGAGSGTGICGLVFIVFLVLKLTETGVVASWSWWWVTAPLWVPVITVLAVAIVFFIIRAIIKSIWKI
jgi:hypothetical protein